MPNVLEKPDSTSKPKSHSALGRDSRSTPAKSERSIFDSLYERLVLGALEVMDQGTLRLSLPQGREITLGKPDADFKASIRVLKTDFFRKCVLYGDIGFGEAYVDGDWDTDNLTAVIQWMILNVESNPSMSGSKRPALAVNLLQGANRLLHTVRPNNKRGSRKNIEAHYDLSNNFFKAFLDPSMTYSSAIFESADQNLEDAQWVKYDRLCRKLKLKATDRVLEIGCGWGGFAVHAAKHYGCRVTGITISKEQLAYARERVQREGLSAHVDIRYEDYRNLTGSYDKIVSIEMLEAVGHEYLEAYFAKCHALLKPQGVLGLQVITCADHRYNDLRKGVDWIQKHIFPGSLLPSVSALNRAVNRTGDMVLHHLEDLASHYTKTLQSWRKNLNASRETITSLGFDDAFLRKWNYYFSYCEAAFAMRNIAVLQMVYTRPNNRTL